MIFLEDPHAIIEGTIIAGLAIGSLGNTVTLTLTDSDSCSLFGPFTGHSAYCATDPAASTSRTITVPAPASASHASISGVAARKPKLAFPVAAGEYAAPLRKIAVTLPHGLSFSAQKQRLAAGITIKGANGKRLKLTGRVSHGVLTITLAAAAAKAQVTIAHPGISAGESLASKVRRSLSGKHSKPVKLTFKLRLTDSSGRSTILSLKLRVR